MEHLLSLKWWFSMFDQTSGWWLACSVIALAFLPLVMRWFRALPDRGIGLAPALGILMTTYTAWIWAFKTSFLLVGALLMGAVLLVAVGLRFHKRGRNAPRNACIALAVPLALGCIPWAHNALTIFLGILVWAGVGVAMWWEDRGRLLREFKRRWLLWVVVQVLFTVGFLFFANVRSYLPWASFEAGMSGAEKFDNLAHINACLRSTKMPPEDVWWAGQPINYYYGGHLITATLAKLTFRPGAIAFNLGLAMIFALTLTSAFSLTFNIVNRFARFWRPRWSEGWKRLRTPLWVRGMGWGLLGAVAVALFGNVDALHQTLARDIRSVQSHYDRVYAEEIKEWTEWKRLLTEAEKREDTRGVRRLAAAPKGRPPAAELNSWQLRFSNPALSQVDFWRSSRMIKGTITEFPYFSAILGDHHAHHVVLPFAIVALTAVAGLLRKGTRLKGRRTFLGWLSIAWPELLAMAFLIGAVLPINAWDVIILVPLYLLAVMVATTGLAPERSWRWMTALMAYGILMMGLALFLNVRLDATPLVQSKLILVLPVVLLSIPIMIEELAPGRLSWLVRSTMLAGFTLLLIVLALWSSSISPGDVFLVLLVVGGVALWQLNSDGRLYRWWGGALTTYGVVGVVGVSFALPFKLYFESPFDVQEPLFVSLFPLQFAPALWTAPDFWKAFWVRLPINPIGIPPVRSQLRDYIGHWGIFLIPILFLWVARLRSASRSWERGQRFALWFGLLSLLYFTFNLITNSWVAPITLTLSVGCLILAFNCKRDPRNAAVWVFLTIAFFYSYFVEVLHFDDRYTGELERYNTPFKIFYPLWAPMAVGMCVMLKELVARRPPAFYTGPSPWLRHSPWVGVLVAAGLYLWITSTSLREPALILIGVAAVVAIVIGLVPTLRPRGVRWGHFVSNVFARLAWRTPLLLVVGLLVSIGMLYPIGSTAGRSNWFHNPNVIPPFHRTGPERETYANRTLDASAYLGNKPKFADDYQVIVWINENIPTGSPVLVERVGDGAYQPGSRFATNTGLPTILGWEHHQLQWRGWGTPVNKVQLDKYGEELANRNPRKDKPVEYVHLTGLLRNHVDTIYRARTYEEIKNLLELHRVRYIVVGSLEREAYESAHAEGLAKFEQPPFTTVFKSGQTTLYKAPE